MTTIHTFRGIYPLLEDEIGPMYAMLAQTHGSSGDVFQQIDFPLDNGCREASYEKDGDQVCLWAREAFPDHCQYNSSNYPTRNLTKHTFDAYNKAVRTNEDIRLTNFCCTTPNCPQIIYMKIVMALLQSAAGNLGRIRATRFRGRSAFSVSRENRHHRRGDQRSCNSGRTPRRLPKTTELQGESEGESAPSSQHSTASTGRRRIWACWPRRRRRS